MKLKPNTYYTVDNNSLIVKVIKIIHKSEDYVKIKASLFYKDDHSLIETKTYKILHSNLDYWKEYTK